MAQPRYVFDPATQTYKLLNPGYDIASTSGLGSLYDAGSGGVGSVGGAGPGTTGSGGTMGDVGLGLMGYSEALGGFAPGATVAGIAGGMMADQAIAQNAATDQAIAAANQTNTPVGVTMGFSGPVATTATDQLAAMNAAATQNAQANANAVSSAQAAQAAQAAAEDVASFADTTDAEAGATVGSPSDTSSGGGGDASGNGSGDSPSGPDGGPDGDSTNAGDSSDDSYFKGGRVMNYAEGGGIGGALIELIKNKGLYGGEHGMYNYDPETQTFNLNNQSFGDMPIPLAGQSVAYPQGSRGDRMYTYKPENQSFEKNFAGGGNVQADLNEWLRTFLEGDGRINKPNLMQLQEIASGASGGGSGAHGMYSFNPSDQSFTKNFAGGGIADAAKTQAKGRGSDTMLVHMTPREVQGLQALAMAHGGSLTINPKTGLPEAGFLDAILPTVAGAALMMVPGMQPLAAAALVGGGTALMTGDLSKGFMAGLGAFGGAGIGSALGAAGAAAPAATGQAATLAAAPETSAAIMQSATGAAPTTLGGASYLAIPTETGTVLAPSAAGTGLPMYDVNAFTGATSTAIPPNFTPTGANMMSGIQSLGTEAGRDQVMQNLGGPMGALKTVGMAAGPMLGSMLEPDQGDLKKQQTYIRPYKYDAGRQTDKEGFQYRTGAPGESSSELTYFTPGFTPQGVYRYEDYMAQNMASGGIASMAKGRYLKGHGDGMSDDIPATIEGGQPARLADGEFVVPADVVSHLGNGSSNAGAKKLYKMMDRIRTARTGKKGQAPEVKTEKYMPA